MLATLADPAGARLTHAQMEEQLTALSRELVRTLHQDSLDCGRPGRSTAAG